MSSTPGFSLEHIAWQVAEPVAMADWYVQHLGFTVLLRAPGAAQAHFLKDAGGRTVIEIYRSPDIPVPDYASMHPLTNHVAVSVVEPEEVRDRLLAAGASLVSDFPAAGDRDRLAMLRDPWGLPLQLVHRRKRLGHLRVLCVGQEALAGACNRDRLLPVGFLDPFSNGESFPEMPVGCRTFANLELAMADGPYDLALVVVPNTTKNDFPLEERILRAGIPIACTKLRAADWADVARLAAVADQTGMPYFCNDHYHRSATFVTAKEKMLQIGRLQSVRFHCLLPGREAGFAEWTSTYRHLVLEDLAYHHFATLAFLAGPPDVREGWCRSRCLADDGVTRNDVQYLAAMKNGWVLNYSARWGSAGPDFTSWPGEFRFEGEQGVLCVSREKLAVNGRVLAPDELAAPLDWLDEVMDCLVAGREPKPLARLKEFVPVAEMIRLGLKSNE